RRRDCTCPQVPRRSKRDPSCPRYCRFWNDKAYQLSRSIRLSTWPTSPPCLLAGSRPCSTMLPIEGGKHDGTTELVVCRSTAHCGLWTSVQRAGSAEAFRAQDHASHVENPGS